MAVVHWCSTAARKMMAATEQRLAFSTLSSQLAAHQRSENRRCYTVKGSYENTRPDKEKKIERIKDKVKVPKSIPWPLPFKLI